MIRTVCLTINIASAFLMTINVINYYKYIKMEKSERYRDSRHSATIRYISLLLLSLFMIGYFLDAIDTYYHNPGLYIVFVAVVFFVGALSIAVLTNSQIVMLESSIKKKVEVLMAFVNATDMKDSYTKGHSQQVYSLVNVFFVFLPNRYKTKVNRSKLLDAALLHDIGKICIPDNVLNKKGPLSDDEWEIMKTHPMASKKMLDESYLSEISDWVLYHHEKVNGEGYYRLKSNDIPLESKIIAIADIYSALCTDRSYRNRYEHKEAIAVMKGLIGTHLDEELMQYFCQIGDKKLHGCIES